MTRWWGSILLVALFICLTTLPAVAAQPTVLYACVNSSSGEAKLVSADTVCNRNWTLVQWNVTGPQGPQGEPGPPGPAGQSIMVIDSKGVQVGQYAGTGGQVAVVVLEVNGFLATLYAYADRLSGNSILASESTDCSGPLFTTTMPVTTFPRTGVAPPGNTMMVADPNGVGQEITVRAYRSAFGTCDIIGGSGFPATGYPMIPLVDLDTMFTPPFSVKFK